MALDAKSGRLAQVVELQGIDTDIYANIIHEGIYHKNHFISDEIKKTIFE